MDHNDARCTIAAKKARRPLLALLVVAATFWWRLRIVRTGWVELFAFAAPGEARPSSNVHFKHRDGMECNLLMWGIPPATVMLLLSGKAVKRSQERTIRNIGKAHGGRVCRVGTLRSTFGSIPPMMASATDPAPTARTSSSGASDVVPTILFWYAMNVVFNIVNKQVLMVFPFPWFVTLAQFTMVITCSVVGWLSGVLRSPLGEISPGFFWKLLPAAVFHALGNGLGSVAYTTSSVSFVHVVKCTEPVWMAVGSYLMAGNVLPAAQVLTLIPVMLGVMVASFGELSFTLTGLFAAVGSTISFAGRGIFAKRLMEGSNDNKGMSPLNVQAMDSMLALALTLPVALFLDGPALAATELRAPGHIAIMLACVGGAYFGFNFGAFKLLDKLDVVSHAVCNLGKRIFVIGASVVFFGTPLTARAVVGTFMTIAGSGLYSLLKAKSIGKSKQAPLVQHPAIVPMVSRKKLSSFATASTILSLSGTTSPGSTSPGSELEAADA